MNTEKKKVSVITVGRIKLQGLSKSEKVFSRVNYFWYGKEMTGYGEEKEESFGINKKDRCIVDVYIDVLTSWGRNLVITLDSS